LSVDSPELKQTKDSRLRTTQVDINVSVRAYR
jgi:hypothetical protein